MSEQNERNLEPIAPEAAEAQAAADPGAQAHADIPDDRENAPRGAQKAAPDAEKKPRPKKKKKRKKSGIALPLVAALVAVALIFGLAAGYGIGRSTLLDRLETAQQRVEALEAAVDANADTPAYDPFKEELTGANQDALNDLSGDALVEDGDASALLGEDGFGGEDAASAEGAVVVAEYDGGQLMSSEIAQEYEAQMALYAFSGFDEEEVAGTVLNEVLRSMVSDRVLEAHAREMGLYELNADDHSKIEAEATANYNELLDFYRDYVNTDGMTEEEATGAVKAYLLEAEGASYESLRAELEANWWRNKVFDAITQDVVVSDAALQSAYETKLAEQKESFEAYPDDYEFAQMNGEIIVYNLPGYRAVKMLLLGFDDIDDIDAVEALEGEIAALDAGTDAEQIAQLWAQIDGYYAGPEARMQSVLAELQGGADFDAMIDAYGTDEGMRNAALRAEGYYVAENSLLWPQEMISAAMALEQAGEISAPVRMGDGVCVLQYIGEVDAGEVPLDQVRGALADETLESMRYDAYEAQLDAWLEDAQVKYYPERMQ